MATLISSLTIAAVFVWTFRQPKIYQAICTVVIDPMAPQVLQGVKDVVELGTGSYWTNREFYETQYKIIKSKEVAQRVVDQLGLAHDESYPFPGAWQKTQGKDHDVASIVVGSTTVSPVKDSRIANIAVQDRNPARAAQIANSLAAAYMAGNIEYKMEGEKDATAFLGDQVVITGDKLKQSELELYEYRKKHELLDLGLDTKQNINTQNVQAYSQKLTDLRAKRAELESERKLILAAKDNIDERESLPEVRQNPVIQQLRILYVDLSKTRGELESRYGDKHPNIAAIDRKMVSLRQDYLREVDNELKAHDKAYQALVDNERALRALLENEKREAIDLAKLEVEYKPLARDVENSQKLYALLTQRQKETGITGLIRSNNVRILDRATPDAVPIKPRLLFNMGLAIVAGLMLGVGAALGLEALDNTLKSQEQAETLLGVPVLGMVPVIGDSHARKLTPDEQRENDLSVFRSPRSPAAEACRSIRTNLLFISPERPLRSIVVTSPGPQEGKSTTAISLAVTMAQAGARVLLVDTDLRRPRLHRAFGIVNERGIANAILGEGKLADVILQTEVPNLNLLPCGPIPPNPAELLHTTRFSQIVAELAASYDRVIYDSPPTSAVTDPALIANLADGVLLVLRAGQTTRQAAMFAKRQLADANARVVGTIVNRVDLRDREYNYYYSRYYRSYKYGPYYGGSDGEPVKA